MTTEQLKKHVGRPRRAATDAAILDAVLELVSEAGVSGVTVAEVARRAGVARATVYLRWPSRATLVGAAAKAVAGGRPFALSGDLARDIRTGAEFMRGIVAAPYFGSILPELIRAVLATPQEVSFDVLAPNREAFAAEYRALASAQDLDPGVDSHLAFDLLFGFGLAHLFATGSAPSAADVREMSDVIVAGLRRAAG